MEPTKLLKKICARHEFYLFLVIVLFSTVMTCINRQFLSFETLFDVLNSASTLGVLALGTMIVMVSGGVDVSFSAIAAIAMYVTVSVLNATGGNVLYAFALACLIGGILGLVNAFIIAYFNISTLIVTLATSNIFYGLLLQLVPRAHITTIPSFLANFGESYLIVFSQSGGNKIGLSAIAATMIGIMIVIGVVFRYTSVGRNIFAIGGSKEAAKREGISVWKTQVFVYCIAGVLAGAASVLNVSLIRYVNPFDVYGVTMDVIAAVVLGGARLTGGAGTVLGTFLGVVILFLIKNNLVLMGIPSVWDSVIVGAIIIISITLTIIRQKRAN